MKNWGVKFADWGGAVRKLGGTCLTQPILLKEAQRIRIIMR